MIIENRIQRFNKALESDGLYVPFLNKYPEGVIDKRPIALSWVEDVKSDTGDLFTGQVIVEVITGSLSSSGQRRLGKLKAAEWRDRFALLYSDAGWEKDNYGFYIDRQTVTISGFREIIRDIAENPNIGFSVIFQISFKIDDDPTNC